MAIISLDTPERTREGDTVNYYCASNPLPYVFGSTDSANDLLRIEISNLDTLENFASNLFYSFNTSTDNVTVDVSGVLKSQFSTDLFNETVISENQNRLNNNQFNFEIRCYENDNVTPFFTEQATVFLIAKQIGDEYGANLADKIGGDIDGAVTYQGEFLTEFESPYQFEGYDLELYYINNGQTIRAVQDFGCDFNPNFIDLSFQDSINQDKINGLIIKDENVPSFGIGEYKLKIQQGDILFRFGCDDVRALTAAFAYSTRQLLQLTYAGDFYLTDNGANTDGELIVMYDQSPTGSNLLPNFAPNPTSQPPFILGAELFQNETLVNKSAAIGNNLMNAAIDNGYCLGVNFIQTSFNINGQSSALVNFIQDSNVSIRDGGASLRLGDGSLFLSVAIPNNFIQIETIPYTNIGDLGTFILNVNPTGDYVIYINGNLERSGNDIRLIPVGNVAHQTQWGNGNALSLDTYNTSDFLVFTQALTESQIQNLNNLLS